MKDNIIVVGIAEAKTAAAPVDLISYALGSCVGVCLYDRTAKIAGMVHILLPYREDARDRENPCKFADSGIPLLVLAMEQLGADRGRMTAKIAGGARMFAVNALVESVGDRNCRAVKETLRKMKIRIAGEDIGADYGRTVCFHSETGLLEVRSVKRKTVVI